jgi:hypothetical protein
MTERKETEKYKTSHITANIRRQFNTLHNQHEVNNKTTSQTKRKGNKLKEKK